MQLNAIKEDSYAFFYGILIADELRISKPMEFWIDTGACETVISAVYFDESYDYSQLESGTPAIGIGGYQETFVIHNVRLYLYKGSGKWVLINKFNQMTVLSRRYDYRTGKLIFFPCLLGVDLIGSKYKLVYEKDQVYLED